MDSPHIIPQLQSQICITILSCPTIQTKVFHRSFWKGPKVWMKCWSKKKKLTTSIITNTLAIFCPQDVMISFSIISFHKFIKICDLWINNSFFRSIESPVNSSSSTKFSRGLYDSSKQPGREEDFCTSMGTQGLNTSYDLLSKSRRYCRNIIYNHNLLFI